MSIPGRLIAQLHLTVDMTATIIVVVCCALFVGMVGADLWRAFRQWRDDRTREREARRLVQNAMQDAIMRRAQRQLRQRVATARHFEDTTR